MRLLGDLAKGPRSSRGFVRQHPHRVQRRRALAQGRNRADVMTVAARMPKPGALEFESREVLTALATLTKLALEARAREAEYAARIADLEARQPRRRFTAPPGWLSAQQAAYACGMSLSDFYRKWRKLAVVGVRFETCFMFDPATLPLRK
jgi:hypothetical protein